MASSILMFLFLDLIPVPNPKKAYKRIARTCPFCDKSETRLSRHMSTVHQTEPKVKKILCLPKTLRRKQLALLRNQGLAKKNLEKESPDLEPIKKTDADKVTCQSCLGVYAKKKFYLHAKICPGAKKIRTSLLPMVGNFDGFTDILNSFHEDDIGEICRTDDIIITVGRILWNKDKTKVDKTDEVRKCVMRDMRTLARLFSLFKERCDELVADASAMFEKGNWNILVDSIESFTSDEAGKIQKKIKHGLKNMLYYLLLNAANILEGQAMACDDQTTRKQYRDFGILLKHHQNIVFADAKYEINKSRQERLRLPDRLPEEDSLSQLRDHCLKVIKQMSAQVHGSDYIALRNATCCRITLYNARRGGEASRIQIDQWTNRQKWFNDEQLNNVRNRELFEKMQVVYGTGKGNHLISIIIPHDCVEAMNSLVDRDNREASGILATNNFIFARKNSPHHMIGSDCITTLCRFLDIPSFDINATKQRARVSTIFAEQDIPEADRDYFFKHMGHSAEVNASTYQRPLPVMAMEKVGTFLDKVDGKLMFLLLYASTEF